MLSYALVPLALSAAPPCPDADPIHDATPGGNSRGVPSAPPDRVLWAEANRLREPSPALSLQWALVQLVPSPQFGFGKDGAVFGLRWQVTPLLYSFATDPRLSPWRWFVVEPVVRQSGSVELFFSPEYLSLGHSLGDRVGFRAGLRSYFGLVQRGDYLSVSLGTAYYHFAREEGIAYEAGAYVLFGMLGVQLGYAPGLEQARWLSTLRLRFF